MNIRVAKFDGKERSGLEDERDDGEEVVHLDQGAEVADGDGDDDGEDELEEEGGDRRLVPLPLVRERLGEHLHATHAVDRAGCRRVHHVEVAEHREQRRQ